MNIPEEEDPDPTTITIASPMASTELAMTMAIMGRIAKKPQVSYHYEIFHYLWTARSSSCEVCDCRCELSLLVQLHLLSSFSLSLSLHSGFHCCVCLCPVLEGRAVLCLTGEKIYSLCNPQSGGGTL